MIYLGNSKGLTDPETLKCSKKLDQLILKFLQRQK
ncbi:aspartyl-phosphate phosphatase Spo0E family protein [Mesobacillus subterraneus]|nr:aspartyl-phosphate phosphatase Spo0E family protein [Mesobacillus subterraneus]MCM3683242.1 aspartyl-phosphate phosphatase Spo0E family protein [Mesobacillus subterraneus]